MGRRRPPCPSGKQRYRDQAAAHAALFGVSRRRNARRGEHREQSAYRCVDCRGWHLTSLPPTNKSEGTR